jgi:cell division control protein 6
MGIIMNPEPMGDGYIPDRLLFRDLQYAELSRSCRNLPAVAVLEGKTGTGKTALARKVLGELGSSGFLTVYTVCEGSSYRTLVKILQEFRIAVPHGFSWTEAWGMFERRIEGRKTLVALDEVDALITNEAVSDEPSPRLLYYLLERARVRRDLGLILISNRHNFLDAIMDDRVKSRISGKVVIAFPPYTPQELEGLLAQRAELALRPGSYTREVLSLCAAMAMQSDRPGDAREAISILAEAASLAEREGCDRIDEGHVRRAVARARGVVVLQYARGLDNLSLLLFYTVVRHPGLTPSEVLARARDYAPYFYVGNFADCTASKRIFMLERSLLRVEKRGRGRGRGVERRLYPPTSIDPEGLREVLRNEYGIEAP